MTRNHPTRIKTDKVPEKVRGNGWRNINNTTIWL